MDQQLQVQATTSTTLNDEADTCVGTVDSVAVPIPPDLVPLLESTAVAFVSTIGPRGEPQTTPMW